MQKRKVSYIEIHFDSNLAGKTVIIQYISDGVATDDEMIVHKFAEEAMYKHIAYSILNTRTQFSKEMPKYFPQEEMQHAIIEIKVSILFCQRMAFDLKFYQSLIMAPRP